MALISHIITALNTAQINVRIGIIKKKEDSIPGNIVIIKIILS
jgi:hypothetical protein